MGPHEAVHVIRVLVDTYWESKFPLVLVRALERIEALSDHAPIPLGPPDRIVNASSSLNCDGYIGRASLIWFKWCGKSLSLARARSKGGTIKYVQCLNT